MWSPSLFSTVSFGVFFVNFEDILAFQRVLGSVDKK